MGKPVRPRHGSMQFWPRKRAKTENVRIRSFADAKETKLLGFAGYKAGMTHVTYTDGAKNSITKGEVVTSPVTIIECPPMTVVGARAYQQTANGLQVVGQTIVGNLPKSVKNVPELKGAKSQNLTDLGEYDFVRALVATQPASTGFAKKGSDVFELAIGGEKDAQVAYITENLGKDLAFADIFKAGDLLDTHAVTKGKGFQGSTKRFGLNLRSHKSEKSIRGPGSLGGWKGHMHFMYRLPMSGQMGYNQRTEYNKYVMMVGDDAEKINPVSGITHYGKIKSTYVLIKGSVAGAKKRLIKFTPAIRPNKKLQVAPPGVEHISLEAQN